MPGAALLARAARALSAAEIDRLRAALGAPEAEDDPETQDLLRRFLLAQVLGRLAGPPSLDRLLAGLVAIAIEATAAERGTLFLHDPATDELYSRVAEGGEIAEIRIPAASGLAGACYASGNPLTSDDPYGHPAFCADVDQRSGYRTRSLLCVPVRDDAGVVVGVMELLNRREGSFSAGDVALVELITAPAAAALLQARAWERLERSLATESRSTGVYEALSLDLRLEALLPELVDSAACLLESERATLFLHDAVRGEIRSQVTTGGPISAIRMASDAGIAGAAFTDDRTIAVQDVYADARFNPAIDGATGYRTRNVLCTPVHDGEGRPVGVLEVLNRRQGDYTDRDRQRIEAFARQVGVALRNARRYEDAVRRRMHDEALLTAFPSGVLTLDASLRVTTANPVAARLLGVAVEGLNGRLLGELLGTDSAWLAETLHALPAGSGAASFPAVDLVTASGQRLRVNVGCTPLPEADGTSQGRLLVLEDLTREERMRATMARYLTKDVVDEVLANIDVPPESRTQVASVLFCDIRRFTQLTEAQSTPETVAMLNEYFTAMVEVVLRHGGVLDKFIGDAIMAVFGAPRCTTTHADDAVAAAGDMLRALAGVNAHRRSAAVPPLEIGIGIATGEVTAGGIGSDERMDYTVIGDTVNLAARLEAANKYYHSSVLLCAETRRRLTVAQPCREIDLIRVRGRDRAVAVHELVPGVDAESRSVREAFDAALCCYRARDWTTALRGFSKVLRLRPADGPAWVYVDRCLGYQRKSPPEGWDGVCDLG